MSAITKLNNFKQDIIASIDRATAYLQSGSTSYNRDIKLCENVMTHYKRMDLLIGSSSDSSDSDIAADDVIISDDDNTIDTTRNHFEIENDEDIFSGRVYRSNFSNYDKDEQNIRNSLYKLSYRLDHNDVTFRNNEGADMYMFDDNGYDIDVSSYKFDDDHTVHDDNYTYDDDNHISKNNSSIVYTTCSDDDSNPQSHICHLHSKGCRGLNYNYELEIDVDTNYQGEYEDLSLF